MDTARYCFVKQRVYLDLSVSRLNCQLHIGWAGWGLASGGWEACIA